MTAQAVSSYGSLPFPTSPAPGVGGRGLRPDPVDRFEPSRPSALDRLRSRLGDLREGAIVGGAGALAAGGWMGGAFALLGLAGAGHFLAGVGVAVALGVGGVVAAIKLAEQ